MTVNTMVVPSLIVMEYSEVKAPVRPVARRPASCFEPGSTVMNPVSPPVVQPSALQLRLSRSYGFAVLLLTWNFTRKAVLPASGLSPYSPNCVILLMPVTLALRPSS